MTKKKSEEKSKGASDATQVNPPKVHCANTELVAVEKVKPNPENPNTHPPEQIEKLAENIKTLGWRAPITVSTLSGMIVRGHGRLAAAKLLGLKKVPVDYQDYENQSEEIADLLFDNAIPELAEIDNGMLSKIVGKVDTKLIDIELTGYSQDDIDGLIDMEPAGGDEPTTGTGMFIKVSFEAKQNRKMNDLFNQLTDDGYKVKMVDNTGK